LELRDDVVVQAAANGVAEADDACYVIAVAG
jgi:hypothetical protein